MKRKKPKKLPPHFVLGQQARLPAAVVGKRTRQRCPNPAVQAKKGTK